ncbi:ABC transporter substrate-binding protein [Streptomyces sp. NPDC003007]
MTADDPGGPLRIGALVPLTRPGRVQAGQHLLAGLESAVRDVNEDGGIAGRPLELAVRDTAADPRRAEAAVEELARLGAVALAGEYHSAVARAGTALKEKLGAAPSFVAFEGYDAVAVLAAVLRSHGTDRASTAAAWPHLSVRGTRGQIRFSRTPGSGVWQWAGAPVQVVDRDPAEPDRFRILHTG